MVALSLLSLLLPTAALATPWRRDGFQGPCTVPASAFGSLPSPLDPLQSPPSLVLVGYGVQNYTCNANGTYTNVGALAELYDISCMFGTAEFGSIQNDAFEVWNTCNETNPFSSPGMVQQMQAQFNLTVDGQHYFVSQNGTLEAVWDLSSSGQFAGNPGAIVFAHKVETASSPDGPNNVPWLELKADSGQLAGTIYRLNTVQGQPPGSCSSNSSISVKYAAKYLLL
ncbi:hypothetical protein F5888DRAFT_1703111 [Russula emetica]|nr:hypothetical protein F5888DRAFT_1703111 [Russula emetica]